MGSVHGIGIVSAIGRNPSDLGIASAALTVAGAFDADELRETPFVQGSLADTEARDALGLALEASRAALQDAGLDPSREKIALVLCTGAGDVSTFETNGSERNPYDLARSLADELGLKGCVTTVTNACASALYGASMAIELLEHTGTPVLLCGVEAKSDTSQYTFKSILALDPNGCRPFQDDRNGTVLGAGAAALVLRNEPSPYGSISSVALTCDGYHDTAPDPEGRMLRSGVLRALEMADCEDSVVDLFVPHATGTKLNDEIEQDVLADVFGASRFNDRTILLKGDIGHTCGASAAFSMVAAAKRIRSGAARAALVGANAFGGNNACVLMQRPEGAST